VGKFKDTMIGEMDVHQVKELVNNFTASNDKGYVLFLEEQLKKAEAKIENMHKVIGKKKNPGYCVECFESISTKEIICGKCQDERDGRFDHLRE
jgi:6-pyruvoyl-tetrahydropterin synthase